MARVKPSSWKISQISSTTWVTRWRPPVHVARPGMVRSAVPGARPARANACWRASSAAANSRFSAFAAAPMVRRGSGSSLGRRARILVRAPALRPRISVFRSWSRRWSACGMSGRRSRSASRAARRSRMVRGEGGGLLRDLRQLRERDRVTHRQVGQDLAVDLDAGPAQPVHEPAVGQLVQPRGRIDAGNPQPPEIALLAPAVAVGVLLRPLDALLGRLPQLAAPAPVALGELHDLVLALQAGDVAFDARHG